MMKRKNRQKGFTLAEALIAVLILLMVSAVVAAGVPAAKRAYEKVTVSANAQVLISTAASALREELGTASDVEESGTGVKFYSSKTGSSARIYTDGDGVIMLENYISYDGEVPESTVRALVNKQTSTPDLYVTFEGIDVGETAATVKDLHVTRESTGERVISLEEYVIHFMARSSY